jgi:asparagine synthetase B (glutamine-hydrolysing)
VEFLGDFFLEAWSDDAARTIYRDIKRLPPGHVLKFSKGRVDLQRSLKLLIEDALRLKRPEEYIEAYRQILWKAVSDRLPEGSARTGKALVVVVGCGAPAVPFDSEIRPW